ncbi:MAG: hypothetical protein KGY50_02020 [Candidatus Thermoplasmatota archaeon]|nr:hypothetical protein [Candidatus Thermoplasmatota archaeon]
MNDKIIQGLMPEESSEDFSLARTINITYTPNKILIFLLLLVLLGTIGWGFYTGQNLFQSISSGILQLFFVFFCWAIGRELDPDHDYAAFFGIPLLFLPLTMIQGNVFVLLWFLISLRLINQTTGKKTTSTDIIFFVFLTLFSAFLSSAILLLPLAIIIILLSSILPKKQPGLSLLSIPLFPSLILLLLINPDAWSFLNVSPWILIYIAISSALLFLVTTTTDELKKTGDHSLSKLSSKRVQSAQLLCVLSVLIISTFHGNILSVFPVWAAITGIGFYRLIRLIIK